MLRNDALAARALAMALGMPVKEQEPFAELEWNAAYLEGVLRSEGEYETASRRTRDASARKPDPTVPSSGGSGV